MLPTKITPSTWVGCLVSLFGYTLVLDGLLCGYLARLIHQAELAHRQVKGQPSVGEFLAGGALLIAVGIAIIWWGLRHISKMNASDRSDPKVPTMK